MWREGVSIVVKQSLSLLIVSDGYNPSMRLLIVTHGSRGDVQPYVALGCALKAAGHEVTIATNSTFATLVGDNRLNFAECGGDVRELVNTPEAKRWMGSGKNPIAFVRGFRALIEPNLHQWTKLVLQAAQANKAEAIIGSATGLFSAYSVAEALELPYIHAWLQPAHPTHMYPSPLIPFTLSLGPLYNYLSYPLFNEVFWQAFKPTFNQLRKDIFNLPPIARIIHPRNQQPVIYGFSPAVLPTCANWPAWVKVSGYWFLDSDGWQPPAELEEFLADGPPPICIGFGSLSESDPGRITDAALEALRKTKRRAVLLSGWGGLTTSATDKDIIVIDEAPHAWLFPRCHAVVHHCGAGTSAAVMRAGVPGIPVPFFADQPFWAHRAYQMGVSTRAIKRIRFDARTFADAIQSSDDPRLRQCANSLGIRIQSEHGVNSAAAMITEHLNSLA